jgi:hypothetical protein
MENLSIMTQPAVSHVAFGWFNLAWPNIAFWIAVIVVFFVFAWARIPLVMEADAESRGERADT